MLHGGKHFTTGVDLSAFAKNTDDKAQLLKELD